MSLEPGGMSLALVNKWKSFSEFNLLRKAKTTEQEYLIALELERKASQLKSQCGDGDGFDRTLFSQKLEAMLRSMIDSGEL